MCLQQLANKICVSVKAKTKSADVLSAFGFYISINPKGLMFAAGADHKNKNNHQRQKTGNYLKQQIFFIFLVGGWVGECYIWVCSSCVNLFRRNQTNKKFKLQQPYNKKKENRVESDSFHGVIQLS